MVFYLISGTCHFHSAHMHPVFRFNILRRWSVLFFCLLISLGFYICFCSCSCYCSCDTVFSSLRFSYIVLFRFFSHDCVVFLWKAFLFDQFMFGFMRCIMAAAMAGWLFGWLPTTVTLAECLFNRTFSVSMIWVDDICLLLIGLCSFLF